jgi:hypothetical protein
MTAQRASKDKPLTLAAYEPGNALRAYVVHAAVGDALPKHLKRKMGRSLLNITYNE